MDLDKTLFESYFYLMIYSCPKTMPVNKPSKQVAILKLRGDLFCFISIKDRGTLVFVNCKHFLNVVLRNFEYLDVSF